MNDIIIQTDFIKLGQFLKLVNAVNSGGEIKFFLETNDVFVNEQKEDRRGRKLRNGDIISINQQNYRIVQDGEIL
ncbi:MAG: S4 domain-containing protein YaaA [Clostridiaceae bacterium]|nr:S4 domain-containing protein YaaA [Clostridiaceae bacterium]